MIAVDNWTDYWIGPQYYVKDLSHVTGKAAMARNRAINAIIKEDFPNLKLTHKPVYSPFIRTGVAEYREGTQLGKNTFSSRNELRDSIVHEELHHRWWKRGIFEAYHPVPGDPNFELFYKIIARNMRLRGW